MSEKTAKTVVLLTGAFMFAAIAIKRDTIPDPFRFAWASGVITLGLSVLADLAPEIAGPFALLVLIFVYQRNKGVLGSVISPPTKAATPTPTTTTSSPTAARTAKQTTNQSGGGSSSPTYSSYFGL